MLKVEAVNLFYGAIHALHDISFHVDNGEIVTLIGANGAGKTSILHAISGLIPIKTGEIGFLDQNITKVPAHKLVGTGLVQVPEGRRVFSRMSVLENLEMGAYSRSRSDDLGKDLERVFSHFPRLKERRRQAAGTLSGGEQQMLAIGRALMSDPKLLLLDEPSLGLAPLLVRAIFDTIRTINAAGVTVVLVEQNAKAALKLAHRGYVLEVGRIILQGEARELLTNPEVRNAYLGGA